MFYFLTKTNNIVTANYLKPEGRDLMIITIGGQAGSGKSSVSRELARRLGYRHYSAGEIRRKMAEKRGLTLAELNKLGEKKDFTDREVDKFQEELGKKEDNFVIDGRLCFHFIPHSVKIYLKADLDVRAERVFRDERIAEKFENIEDAKNSLREREKSDSKRYRKYYNLDCSDEQQYDLVIDTTHISVKDVVERILEFLGK